MLFPIQYFLTLSGYSAVGILLGSYMIEYAGAKESDLGIVYMVQPMMSLMRPFISAHADRYQSHRKLYITCLIVTSCSYIPFIVLPALLKYPMVEQMLVGRIHFWLLMIAHIIGSIGLCGVRSLGDALAVNYAKRAGEDFASYRKYGSISFGLVGLLLGQINQDWILPDFVPSMCMYVFSSALLALFVYVWHDEFFVMKAYISGNSEEEAEKLPSRGEIASHIELKLRNTLLCSRAVSSKVSDTNHDANYVPTTLSASQQVSIFLLLLKRDIRIPMFLVLMFYAGMVGHGPLNFIFTFIIKTCNERGTCNGASFTGLLMICYCVCETVSYMVLNNFRGRLNYLFTTQITFVSLMIHYYFYGFFINQVSHYFFFIECLHGLEYSLGIVASVELGNKFGNEVQLILPELIERGIISKDDNQEIVKLCLLATMNSCFTLVYDGLGTMVGSILYGFVIGHFSFNSVWLVIGTMSVVGFFSALLVYSIGKCFHIEPQICRIERARKSSVIKAEL